MVTMLNQRHEKKQWLRKERLESYSSMLEFLSNAHDEIRLNRSPPNEMPLHHFKELNRVSGRVNMLASADVSNLMRECTLRFAALTQAQTDGNSDLHKAEQEKFYDAQHSLNTVMAYEVQLQSTRGLKKYHAEL